MLSFGDIDRPLGVSDIIRLLGVIFKIDSDELEIQIT